jgi:hypothetical protein
LKSWGQAKVACKNLGMALASIETEEANNCIKEKIQFAGWRFSLFVVWWHKNLTASWIFQEKWDPLFSLRWIKWANQTTPGRQDRRSQSMDGELENQHNSAQKTAALSSNQNIL